MLYKLNSNTSLMNAVESYTITTSVLCCLVLRCWVRTCIFNMVFAQPITMVSYNYVSHSHALWSRTCACQPVAPINFLNDILSLTISIMINHHSKLFLLFTITIDEWHCLLQENIIFVRIILLHEKWHEDKKFPVRLYKNFSVVAISL